MLKLTALHLQNFGPFKGDQTVKFPSEDGVTVVYGENMRGKTTLLNAIRFAFFGKVIGRGTKQVSLHRVGNWEQAQMGHFGFQVALEFEDDGHEYQLTRGCVLRPGVSVPTGDDDYVVRHFLRRDGHNLGPQQSDAELARVLPEQIARFFLFDGELLQEYEDLLSSETDMGRRISDAIERILGVPVLTSTRTTLLGLKGKSERREATAAQGDQKTREYGNQLADLHTQRDVLAKDLVRLEAEMEGLRANKAALEESMKKRERVAALLDKRDTLERLMGEIQTKLLVKRAELQQAMGDAWISLISEPVRGAATSLREQERELQGAVLRAEVLRGLQSDTTTECPACTQAITPEARTRLETTLHGDPTHGAGDKPRRLAEVRRKLAALDRYAAAGGRDILKHRWEAVEELALDYTSKLDERDEIAKQLENIDEDSLRKTKADFEATIRQIDAVERGISETRARLETNKSDAENIQRKLDRLAGVAVTDERRRRECYSELHRLFNEAVGAYREQLRKRVEADATRHFRALTTEPEYAGLRINDSYGLMIVHKDGSDIPVRSAGAEHIVALSLVGALQNNAPLRGPIVVDSPFGRLDGGHRRNVVRALPQLARQVVLLAYENELPPALARGELAGDLRAEWRLERRSARHTDVVPRRD